MSGIAAERGRGVSHHPVLRILVQGAEFCLNLPDVGRIIPLSALHPVPNGPDYLQGILGLAGDCVPVIDLARRLGIARAAPYTLDTPLLVCRRQGRVGALAVDQVLGVSEVTEHDAQLADLFAGGLPAFIAAVRTPQGVVLKLDLVRILDIDLGFPVTDLELPSDLLAACRERFGSEQDAGGPQGEK